MVMSFLNEKSTDPLGNRVGGWGGGVYSKPPRPLSTAGFWIDILTINAPLILKMRDIIFFCGQTFFFI
jgi:hypothetical protein